MYTVRILILVAPNFGTFGNLDFCKKWVAAEKYLQMQVIDDGHTLQAGMQPALPTRRLIRYTM